MNPRDIAFVVDLSGSMNDDTTPGSSTCNTGLMQTVYNEFGFGTYPGSSMALNTSKSTSWVMTNQIKPNMPNATPRQTHRAAHRSIIGAVISVTRSPTGGGKLGYQSYLAFMMYYGRDVPPDGTDYTPLSLNSNLCRCPLHSETVGGRVV